MSELTEVLEIALLEQRRDFVCNITAEFVDSLKLQGFGLDEILDGLMNYAWVNTNSTDAICLLAKASLSLRNKPNG